MATALTLLFIGSLLQGTLCGEFRIFMPQTIEVLSGSCVTIPCSFDIVDKYKTNLDNTCKAIWTHDKKTVVFDSSNPQQTPIKGNFTGDLKQKDCTTTLNNMKPADSNTYNFRLECDSELKYNFVQQVLSIVVEAHPPRPTLSPSTLEVKEGTSVSLRCSAPAPCLSHPPSLTWTPSLGDSQETLQENQDKTQVQTSVVTFTASHLHHGQTVSCTAIYNKQDGSSKFAVIKSLTAQISYSPKHTTVSVHPSGPVPEGRNVTLTCNSSANPAVNYTWYRADGGQETFIGDGRVLIITASKDNSSFFCKAQNHLGTGRSNISQIDVQFAPQILLSSDCNQAPTQLSCSCRTVGNPSPTLQWYLDGLPVNHSDKFIISNLNGSLGSIFTANHPQENNLSTLLCRSFNSLGSASQRFCFNSLQPQTSAQSHDQVMFPAFITTVVTLLVLVFALLFTIRVQRIHYNLLKNQCTDDIGTVTINQLLTSGEENEVANTTNEDIYANTHMLRLADVTHPATISEPNSTNLPSSEPNNAEGAINSSEDVIYTTVNWKTKSKKKKGQDAVDMHQPGSSYLEEERCSVEGKHKHFVSNALEMENLYDTVEPRNVKKEGESEYAQVKFKNKSAMQK